MVVALAALEAGGSMRKQVFIAKVIGPLAIKILLLLKDGHGQVNVQRDRTVM